MGRMRIISVEGLIGFKLQGFVNDASRTRDLDDIRALFKIHRASLNIEELRVASLPDALAILASEAGLAFQPLPSQQSGVDPIAEWLSLMEVVQMLCPMWPVRDQPMRGSHWRL